MSVDVYVFDKDITPLGLIDVVTGLTWEEKFADAGSVELWCPLNDKNAELLREDNLLWIGGESAGIVEFKELTADTEGVQTIHIQGRLAESYLDYRVIYPTVSATGKLSDILRGYVDKNLVNPVDPDRKIPAISLAEDQETLGPSVSNQKTGDTVLIGLSDLCQANNMGFRLQFLPREYKFVFRVYEGVNRTIDQQEQIPVLFSSEMEDILESNYSHNKSDMRNFAYVAGEGEGSARKVQTVGDATGLDRRELYVDARDLQSEQNDGTVIPDREYEAMLLERGKTSLEDYKDIETFSASLRIYGVTGYQYGKDFSLGDTVTVYDARLRVRTNAAITAVAQTFDEDGSRLDITFGYSQPTLAKKLRRRMI